MEARAQNVVKGRNRSILRLVNESLWLDETEAGVAVADNGGVWEAPKDSIACSAWVVSGAMRCSTDAVLPCPAECAIRSLSTRDEALSPEAQIASRRYVMGVWAVRLSSALRYAISTHPKCATPLL